MSVFGKCALGAIAMFGLAMNSSATLINFDDQGLIGPSYFAAASPSPQHLVINTLDGTVTFDGGVILTNTSNLPADETSVYGSASFATGNTNPMTIKFQNPINNFYMDLLNGWTQDMTYEVQDNLGNVKDYTMPSNMNGGNSLVEFPTLGSNLQISSITFTGSWDFFVDNIHFNETLPSQNVPEPALISLLGLGLLGLAGIARRKRS